MISFYNTAANILRRDIHNLDIKNDFYPAPSECSLSNSIHSMPPTLTKFICWLIVEKSFSAVNIQKEMSEEKMRKYMSLSECIVSLCKSVITPFQIGLALQFYHDEFGSKQLIETLHAHGFCSSYDEVRRYLTSLANHEIDKIKKGVYAPNGIIPIASGGCLVQEGSANIDINTETADGKIPFIP
jgi:hypothetical protein